VPPGPEASDRAGAGFLEALRSDPARGAVLTDIDGTLAPIVARPEQAAVPPRASELLRALGRRYAAVGCVSGRPAEEARRLVGVPELSYAGNHGLELLLPGDPSPRLDPALERWGEAVAGFAGDLDRSRLRAAGLRIEDKGPIQALHWRGAGDEEAAERLAREVAREAEGAGLRPHWGRKVLELRPPVEVGKDTAVSALLAPVRASAAVYAGDDRTDLDAFRRLRQLRDGGELKTAVCVAITSREGPPELAAESDITVDGPEAWLKLLESLARVEDG
jgi:trehalose 6-phosphate phosphatase